MHSWVHFRHIEYDKMDGIRFGIGQTIFEVWVNSLSNRKNYTIDCAVCSCDFIFVTHLWRFVCEWKRWEISYSNKFRTNEWTKLYILLQTNFHWKIRSRIWDSELKNPGFFSNFGTSHLLNHFVRNQETAFIQWKYLKDVQQLASIILMDFPHITVFTHFTEPLLGLRGTHILISVQQSTTMK